MENIRGLRIHYTLIQVVYWSICAIFMVYIVPLLRERGFDNAEIGVLLAVRSFSCILFQPIVASFADKHTDAIPLKYIVSIIVLVSLITTVLFLIIRFSFWGCIVVFAFLGASITSLSPFYNSMALQYLNIGKDLKFSEARGYGSIAYAVCCIILAFVVDLVGVNSTLYLQVGMLIVSFIIVITFRTCNSENVQQSEAKRPNSTWHVITKNRGYGLFLLASIFLYVGNNMTISFLVDVVDKLGGTNADVGYCQFILAASEFPIALCFIKLKNKIGTKNIMRISAVFIVVKILGVLLAPNIPILIAVHIFQMLGSGLYWSGSVYFVTENVAEEDSIKGQSLVTIFSTGFGSGIGALISGWISSLFGVDILIGTATVCAFVGMIIMFKALNSTERSENEEVLRRKNYDSIKYKIIN